MTVNHQVSLLDLTVKTGFPGDVMRALIGGMYIVYVPRQDALLVNMVNEVNDEDFAIQMKEVTLVTG